MTATLEIVGLRRAVGGKPLLKSIDLELDRGEVVALVGPSGCGKTTLLRCVNRLDDPDAGRILLDGLDVREIPPHDLRRRVGMVFQESVMLPGTVAENIAYGPSLDGRIGPGLLEVCAEGAGLSRRILDRDVSVLSGGERQRVAIARALATRPEILLMDEPTSEIDPKRMGRVEKTLRGLVEGSGLSILWVTHDADQARRVGDHVANLKDGVIRQSGRPDEIDWGDAY